MNSGFQRYAVYYLPEDARLVRFGSAWLGWDIESGAMVEQPVVKGADIQAATVTPRRYGFHGTLKPPFRLSKDRTAAELEAAVASFAALRSPVAVAGLELDNLGQFLALVPTGETSCLSGLAFEAVRVLDDFRAPAFASELQRRRARGLTPQEDEMLRTWGYPYVGPEFRFHLTLSGRSDPDTLLALKRTATRLLPPLPQPYPIASISLVGERGDGNFQLIQRYDLTG
ncbi:MAG: DUF1045 domain-containing protein [Pseudomonadota bacterium]